MASTRYRRQAGGNRSFFAPEGGQIERRSGDGSSPGIGAQPGGVGGYRIAAGPNTTAGRTQARGDRVPNVGSEAKAQEVAALERQDYARALAQMRTQNVGPSDTARRGGGRRR